MLHMAHRTTLNISLTPELQRFVEVRVASGRYQSASEVVREGLRLLEGRELAEQAAIQGLRRRIGAGLRQAKRGELLDGEKVFENLAQRLQKRRARVA
jgi:antitoxin ParD1/3/4